MVYTYEYADQSEDEDKPTNVPTTNILFKKARAAKQPIPELRSQSHNREIGSMRGHSSTNSGYAGAASGKIADAQAKFSPNHPYSNKS